ncbi:helix-turn-helix transcriptional regulator [Vibrio rarus]|uniref:helix-turn-helix transcriptional regulator n=1 Tax=Vibrio rarus TaxID=413403 RepID=UPI0021C25849|nr:WYL domain-containing protein [Vibrio rarus]
MPNNNAINSTVLRLFELCRKLPSPNAAGISTHELHQSLVDEGFDVTKRTTERDLIKLQHIIDIDSKRTPDGNTWKHAHKNSELVPTMQPTEAFLLLTIEKTLRRIVPPESIDILDTRVNKAKKVLSGRNNLRKWQEKLHVVDGQHPHTTIPIDAELIKQVYEAVINETQLEFLYQKLDAENASTYILNPLAIVVREHAHYLVATKSETPEKPQLFNLTRMHDAKQTYLPYQAPKAFRLHDYINANPTGWILLKQPTTIRIKVRHFALDWVRHGQLHPSQEVIPLDEEWHQVTLKTQPTYDIVGWVLRFSVDAVIMEPQLLIDEIRGRLEKMTKLYK